MFYDHAIYPAARLVAPSRMAEWPSNHVVALQGSRNDKGHLVSRSNLIAAKDVRVFGEAILEACNTNPNLSWAKDAFFIHQVKGVKGAFSIDVDKAELNDDEEGWSRQANMDTFMESIDYDFSDDTFDQAFIDVGLEFSMQGHVLHWDQNAHRDVVDFVIENMEAASQLTKQGHKGYWCDYASLLTGTAGFRAIIPPCTNPNCWDATYVQAYCTDKHLSTSAEKGSVAKHVRVLDILLDSPAYKKTIGEILEQCNSAVNNKLSANARLEVRVPLKHGCEVLPYMNADTMKSCLLVYKSSTWW